MENIWKMKMKSELKSLLVFMDVEMSQNYFKGIVLYHRQYMVLDSSRQNVLDYTDLCFNHMLYFIMLMSVCGQNKDCFVKQSSKMLCTEYLFVYTK